MALSEAYLPTEHVSQMDEPSFSPAWPAPQATHVAEERARVAEEEVPTGQDTHVQLA